MKRFDILIAVGAAIGVLTLGGGQALAAADCGEPVAAPRWEIGDNWTIQDELGDERTETVVGIQAGLTLVEIVRTGQKTIFFYDAEHVLRKVVNPDGTVLDRPGRDRWFFLGQKTLEFPLVPGKTWGFSFERESALFQRSYRVVACEEVTVVAGRFPALKIEVSNRRDGGRGGGTQHEWYAAEAKRIIRGTYRRRDQGNALFQWELLRYRVNPSVGR